VNLLQAPRFSAFLSKQVRAAPSTASHHLELAHFTVFATMSATSSRNSVPENKSRDSAQSLLHNQLQPVDSPHNSSQSHRNTHDRQNLKGLTKTEIKDRLRRAEMKLNYEKQRRKEAEREFQKQQSRELRSLDTRILRGGLISA